MKNKTIRSRGFALAVAGLLALAGCDGGPAGLNSRENPSLQFIRVSPPARNALSTAAVGQTSSSANFNGTAIAAGNRIWFSAVCKYSGATTALTTFHIVNAAIDFTSGGVPYEVPVPGATLVFSPGATSATTQFDASSGTWVTSTLFKTAGNVFLTGLAWTVPADLPGGIQNVTFSATFTTDTPGVSLQWQWSAAVYSAMSDDPQALNVKPLDDTHFTAWNNSDHAGTPEAFKSAVKGGAMGGGGSNYTGGLSPSFVVIPGASATDPLNGSGVISGDKGGTLSVGRFTLQVPAHAFAGTATLTIHVPDQSVLRCDLSISPASANGFAVPVTLETSYAGGAVTDPGQLVELWFDESMGVWRAVPSSSVDQTNQVVVAPLMHFSRYGVASNDGKAGW